jgi:peptide/nickel transport system substrate-binding protein
MNGHSKDGEQRVPRRAVLKGFAGGVALFAAPSTVSGQGAAREAPALARLVAEGTLPPLAQRIPASPLVVVPHERAGTYGGVLRRGLRGSADHNGILRMVGNQGLVRWNLEFTEVLPNVAERWEVNATSTEFTFYLRKGMRWSDGAPFTADDIVFAIEDCCKNTELYKSPPSLISISGNTGVAAKIDETTVRFSFASPYALFLEQLATPLGQHPTLFPMHYCGQFHPKYNARANDLARAANFGDWPSLFRARFGDVESPTRWSYPGKPTLDPWIIGEPYTGGATRVTMERNPYFWQVDSDGKQLPYIDRLTFSIANDVESLMLDAISGRLDLQDRHIDTLQNKPVLSRNAERGNYRLIELVATRAQQCQIYLNITHRDPRMREMFASKDFRKALSLGINRREIIDLVYLGQSEPFQTGPRPGHPWYHEKLGRQFTEHDPLLANSILDELGYRRDAAGKRRRPDGQPVLFSIDIITTLFPDMFDVLELIARHWAAIGVETKTNAIERTLYYTRGDNNDHDAAVWTGPGGLDPMLEPRDYFAQHPQGSRYAIPWAQWYVSAGKQGEEPPETQKMRMKLFDDARATVDLRQRGEIMRQLFDLAADAFETIGVCSGVNAFGIVKNNLANVPTRYPTSWSWANPGPAMPQQFYFAT